jgi:hypothetical protein
MRFARFFLWVALLNLAFLVFEALWNVLRTVL